MDRQGLNRRRFLQSLCAVGAAAAAEGALFAVRPPLVWAAPLLSADAEGGDSVRETRLLLGTFVSVTARAASRAQAEDAIAAAFAEVLRLESVFNRRVAESPLSVLNAEGRLACAPPELAAVLGAAVRAGRATGDLFNPAVALLVDVYKAAGDASPDGKAVAEALALSQPGRVHVNSGNIAMGRSGMRLTLDGIAKGYIADMASQILLRRGVRNHIINAGGDIRAHGLAEKGRPWSVGIQHPLEKSAVLERTEVRNGGIATSGNYESQSIHLFNALAGAGALSGKSAFLPLSVTVKAPTAMQADALATAFGVVSPIRALRALQAMPAARCLIIGPNGERYTSPGWA